MDDIINLFTKEHGIYKDMLKFNVILFFIIVLFFIVKLNLFNNSIFLIVAFIFALYATNIYVKVTHDDLTDNNKIISYKLDSLQVKMYDFIKYKIDISTINNQHLSKKDAQKLYDSNKLDSLYIDSNIIVFLYSIIKLYDYNPAEFYLLLKGTNNILKIKNDIEKYYAAEGIYPENIHEMLQITLNLKSNCMNNMQNFIYSVPKTNKMYKYIDDIIVTYNILLTNNIKIIHKYHLNHIKQHGINSNTIFIDINVSKPFDQMANHSLIPGKHNLKHDLIDLYP